jgi:hypothetical protein
MKKKTSFFPLISTNFLGRYELNYSMSSSWVVEQTLRRSS